MHVLDVLHILYVSCNSRHIESTYSVFFLKCNLFFVKDVKIKHTSVQSQWFRSFLVRVDAEVIRCLVMVVQVLLVFRVEIGVAKYEAMTPNVGLSVSGSGGQSGYRSCDLLNNERLGFRWFKSWLSMWMDIRVVIYEATTGYGC